MVKSSRGHPVKSLCEELPTRNIPGGQRVVFTISIFSLITTSIFHSCRRITLAAILALVNNDVANKREQSRE